MLVFPLENLTRLGWRNLTEANLYFVTNRDELKFTDQLKSWHKFSDFQIFTLSLKLNRVPENRKNRVVLTVRLAADFYIYFYLF